MERESISSKLPIGSSMPAFSLKNVNGEEIDQSFFQGAAASLVVFSCNHCPYVKGSDEAMLAVFKKYAPQGLRAVAISSNDPVQYPEDDFANMQKKSLEMQLPFPYLFDETQEVARSFDAACTPECYLFDGAGKLVFHGTVNDSPRYPEKVTKHYLDDVLADVIAGKQPKYNFVHPIGCSIKWR